MGRANTGRMNWQDRSPSILTLYGGSSSYRGISGANVLIRRGFADVSFYDGAMAAVLAAPGDRRTEDLYHGRESSRVRRLSVALREATLFKLDVLNAAMSISDLRSPPSNRLEKLRGDLRDYHSIRVNEQWRVIFRWTNGEASAVRLIDYH